MVNILLVSLGHFFLDFVHDSLIGMHHLYSGRAVKFSYRESLCTDPLIDSLMPSHLRLKCLIQRFRCVGPFYLGHDPPAAVDPGVEFGEWDHITAKPKYDRHPTASLPDYVVDIPGLRKELTLAERILFCDRPPCSRFPGRCSAGQGTPHRFMDAATNSRQQFCHAIQALFRNIHRQTRINCLLIL